jgi:mannose-6-phosphate isomerase-like protein (cupin superfamily)
MTADFTHPLEGDSGPSGEHFLFHRSARSPGGLLRFTWTLKPGKSGPAEHRHVDETHSMHILSGKLTVWIEGVRRDLEPGDHFTVPAGARHRFKNYGKVPVVVDAANDGPAFEDFAIPIGIEMQRRGGKMSFGMMGLMIAQARKFDNARPTLRAWPLVLIAMAFGLLFRPFGKALPPVYGWDAGAPPPAGVGDIAALSDGVHSQAIARANPTRNPIQRPLSNDA